MKKVYCVLGILVCLSFVQARGAFAQAGAYDKYLTAADVEKAAGMKGIRLIPKGSAPGAGGDLNFADDSGDLVLMVQVTAAKSFATFKGKYGKAPVAGVGDQAVQGGSMPGMPDNLLVFTKGTHCVVLTAFGDFVTKKLYLTIDQLTALGKLTASRM